ncbi:alpha/beta hydrolase [Acrocarpospora catenulata]|uniref:alpha/beta hydrolase n=1 Tax=Acrocarpospora catenulata TaxID=2836182 RepID=UPI002023A3E5|nr:alpha/beta hydrolase [Acrocarpospora catenulata]
MKAALGVGALALATVLLAAPATATANTAVPVTTKGGDPSPSASESPVPLPATEEKGTFSYGKHVRQRMDVWWRKDGVRRPAVFVVHGGWWASGDKKYMTEVSRSYFQLGYVVININYRLAGDAAWPAQRVDALNAIATMRRHAAQFNMDPDRYVMIGFSAGGHIAAAVGTYGNGQPGLRGVVGISPVISPLTAYFDGDEGATPEQRKLRRSAIALAGKCEPTECPRTWNSMEIPYHASEGDAPVLTVHSTDEFVPPYQSEMLKQALNEVGVAMNIRAIAGAQHSSPLYREPGVAEAVQSWVIARLAR